MDWEKNLKKFEQNSKLKIWWLHLMKLRFIKKNYNIDSIASSKGGTRLLPPDMNMCE